MTKLLAVCIEDVDASDPNERYVSCVALPGRAPGLRIDSRGRVLWRCDDRTACELWVSADDRLVLWRIEGGDRVVVTRANRSLEVPGEKPVMLLNQDEIEVGGRRLRIHLHGQAVAEASPQRVVMQRSRAGFRAAATAAVLGATLVAGAAGAEDSAQPVEVREHPPAPLPPPTPPPTPPPPPPPPPPETDAGSEEERGFAEPPPDERDESDSEVDVRIVPPTPPPEHPPSAGCCTKQPGSDVAWRRGKR